MGIYYPYYLVKQVRKNTVRIIPYMITLLQHFKLEKPQHSAFSSHLLFAMVSCRILL